MSLYLAKRPRLGVYLNRINRFVVSVMVDGQEELAHLANSGRLQRVLKPGQNCWLVPQAGKHRKTRYDLLAVETEQGPIVVDARLPNDIIASAWEAGLIEELSSFRQMQREYRSGSSRFDFAFWSENAEHPCLVEVKSAADVSGELAFFPDAPTKRGGKHLVELLAAAQAQQGAMVILLAQMEWARGVVLNAAIDPELVTTARQAQMEGVQFLAYTIKLQLPEAIHLGKEIPVLFDIA